MQKIAYTLKRDRRMRTVRLKVVPDGEVIVTAPILVPLLFIDRFVTQHAERIARVIARMKQMKTLPVSGRRDYVAHKETARAFVTERVAYWNQFYNHEYGRIAIKDTKRAWGSCSTKGNLNFSYTLAFIPLELADYVVVHELCHLREHNHSKHFWALVAQSIPDYKERRKQLRTFLLR
jgi:predicted metal-dependent hydrolase